MTLAVLLSCAAVPAWADRERGDDDRRGDVRRIKTDGTARPTNRLAMCTTTVIVTIATIRRMATSCRFCRTTTALSPTAA